MDLVIILVGLFMIVEGGPDEPVDILFLQSEGFKDACEVWMPKHNMNLKYWIPGTSVNQAVLVEAPKPVEILLDIARPQGEASSTCTASGESPAVATSGELLKLADLGVNPKIRKECSSPNALTACTYNGKPLLIAKLTLHGGTLTPSEFYPDDEADEADDESEPDLKLAAERPWNFGVITSSQAGAHRSASSPPATSNPIDSRRLYNAIVYRKKVDPTHPIDIHFGNETRSLKPITASICQLVGSEMCIPAVLWNMPPDRDTGHAATTSCHIPGKLEGTRCWLDPHFALNYLLLEDPPKPGEALIPYLCLPEDELSPNEPAGESRCIPPTGCSNC